MRRGGKGITMRRNRLFHRRSAYDERMREMARELSDLRAALDGAYMRFNAATEPELVEACVYEINAAQSRYNYMLRRIRECGSEAAFRAQTGGDGVAWA